MARTFNRLTDVVVKRETQPGLYSDGGGLYLRVRPTGTRSWIFRYRAAGKLHDLGLGPAHTITLRPCSCGRPSRTRPVGGARNTLRSGWPR